MFLLQLSCNATSDAYKELCSGWKVVQYCTNFTPDGTFDFDGEFSMSQDLQTGKCVDIRLRNVTFYDGITHKPICDSHMRTSCIAECYETTALKRMLQEVEGDASLTSRYQFHMFLWAAIVSWIGMAVVVSIADAICFDFLGMPGHGPSIIEGHCNANLTTFRKILFQATIVERSTASKKCGVVSVSVYSA